MIKRKKIPKELMLFRDCVLFSRGAGCRGLNLLADRTENRFLNEIGKLQILCYCFLYKFINSNAGCLSINKSHIER